MCIRSSMETLSHHESDAVKAKDHFELNFARDVKVSKDIYKHGQQQKKD